MRLLILAMAGFVCIAAGAETDVERLKRELKVAAPPEHYPDHAEYRLLPKVCNAEICFRILAVRYASLGKTTVRLAVFSDGEHYIGSYAGLTAMPTRVDGPILHFAASARPNRISFDRPSPPAEIRVGDRTHALELAR